MAGMMSGAKRTRRWSSEFSTKEGRLSPGTIPVQSADKPAVLNLGFLTVLHEPAGFVGGLLITNGWGRPLEFRLTSAVQPNRVQQVLYAGTLERYVYADLIAKTLIDRAGVALQLVVTDRPVVLDVRPHLDVPVVYVAAQDDPRAKSLAAEGAGALPAVAGRGPVVCNPRFPADVAASREVLSRAEGLDLVEPFDRIRGAIAEARKLGVSAR
jgi:hypothetical protein